MKFCLSVSSWLCSSAIVFFASCSPQTSSSEIASPEIYLDSISGKNQKEVALKLGVGVSDGFWKDKKAGCVKCPKFNYASEKYHVIYIGDKADRITINDLSKYDFSNEAILGALGLPAATPKFETDFVKRWENYRGYRQISAFSNEGKVNYILVLSKAE